MKKLDFSSTKLVFQLGLRSMGNMKAEAWFSQATAARLRHGGQARRGARLLCGSHDSGVLLGRRVHMLQ